MKVEIKTATVIRQRTTMDLVVIDTDLPSPVVAEISTAPLSLLFYVTTGKGVEYVRDQFGLEPKVIDMSR